MIFNDEIKQSIKDSVLCWLATVDKQGCPNVSPKEMFLAEGENKLLIANIASPNSVQNIASNHHVCVSFVDVFRQKGFKIKGTANLIEKSHALYSAYLDKLHNFGGDKFRIHSIIEVSADQCHPILAPSYLFFPETTESEQIASAMESYGVKGQ